MKKIETIEELLIPNDSRLYKIMEAKTYFIFVEAAKIVLHRRVADSLDRLVSQNYAARHADNYSFLTDEEQEIAIEIRKTSVDNASIVAGIGKTIFSDIYDSKKYKIEKYDFTYDQYVDDTLFGSASGGMRLRFVTVAGSYYSANENKILNDSRANNEAIIFLSSEGGYFEELQNAAKINKYVRMKNVAQQPENIQEIIGKHQRQAKMLEENAKKQIGKSIAAGKIYICGERADIRETDAVAKIDKALKQLIEGVFSKLDLVNVFCDSDADILSVINSAPEQSGLAGSGSNNEFALGEISQWLEDRSINHVPISMGDVQRRYQSIPYGWREIDIAAIIARLIAAQKVEIRYGGAVVAKDDRNLLRYLRIKTEIDKARVVRRISAGEELKRKVSIFMRSWLGQMTIPDDEDGLVALVTDALQKKLARLEELIKEYESGNYPQKDVVTQACNLVKVILSNKLDNVALLSTLVSKQDSLLGSSEDMEEVETFFKSQRPIFDAARRLQESLKDERNYFASDKDTSDAIGEIDSILDMPKPYRRIKDLSELMQGIKKSYAVMLGKKKNEVTGFIGKCIEDVRSLAGGSNRACDEAADEFFEEYKQVVSNASSLIVLDAAITQLSNHKDQVCEQIDNLLSEELTCEASEPGSSKSLKFERISRNNLLPASRLTSRKEVDNYLEDIRQKLYDILETNVGIQIK
jgi:hypothetical protein